tara:strand:+ start:108858 stop:109166 length:309 start_codon:yes stop_codon:yes gene_type:complete
MVKPPLFVRVRWEAEIAGQAAGIRVEALFQQAFWLLLGSKVSEKMIWISHPKSYIDSVSIFCLPAVAGQNATSPLEDSEPALLKYHAPFQPRAASYLLTLGY